MYSSISGWEGSSAVVAATAAAAATDDADDVIEALGGGWFHILLFDMAVSREEGGERNEGGHTPASSSCRMTFLVT